MGDDMRRTTQRLTAAALAMAGLLGASPVLAASATRSSSFAYDAASGLVNQQVIEPNTPALRLQTDYVYDAFGNKTSVTVSGVDITTRSNASTYDARGQFVSTNTNALSQSESFQYDARFGVATSHTGPNGLTTTWSYDGFGRRTLEVRADGTRTSWTYLFCSGVNGGTATRRAGLRCEYHPRLEAVRRLRPRAQAEPAVFRLRRHAAVDH